MTPSLSSAALINNDDAGNQNEPGATQNETGTQSGAAQSETGNSQSEAAGGNQNEATGATAASTSKPEPSASKQFTLPPLSMQLDLETLWGVLSDCLDALEKTYDSHAVLVLQPTVEAFFLVHGDSNEDTKASSSAERKSQHNFRSRRLPSFHTISDTDSLPGSPAPFVDLSPVPGTPSTVDMEAVDPYAHLPQDTARFLKFAGKGKHTDTHTHTHTHTRTHTHTYTHTQTHTHTHTHTYTHRHTTHTDTQHTHACTHTPSFLSAADKRSHSPLLGEGKVPVLP